MKNNMKILSKKRYQTQYSYVTLLSDIIDAEPSNYEEVTKKKGKTSTRRMMYRIQYGYMKGSSQFHDAVYGNIAGYKARFVARGFSQKESINYEETFAAIGS